MRFLLILIAALAAACGSINAQISEIDSAVLNFALNLEYLEANFYHCVVYGKPIPMEFWGEGGKAPIGCPCKPIKLSATAMQYATEIALDELGHVKLLRAVLGNSSVPQPLINIGSAFAAAADAAACYELKPSFSPYGNPYVRSKDVIDNDILFYHGAFIFEDVGVTAYAGAAALLENKAFLTAAAQILSVEAYHAGAIRTLLFQSQNRRAPFNNVDLRVRDLVQAISDLRDKVDGPDDIDQGVVTQLASNVFTANIAPTSGDDSRIAFTRNATQVLAIVYLGGQGKGGFYPEGLNGAIK